jgi:putative transcriptional regulator
VVTIGKRLRAARTAAGLSQAQLAHRSGVAQPAISRIERDETHDPGLLLVVALARALGVTLDHLVEGSPPTRAQRISLEQRVTALEHALADLQERFEAASEGTC